MQAVHPFLHLKQVPFDLSRYVPGWHSRHILWEHILHPGPQGKHLVSLVAVMLSSYPWLHWKQVEVLVPTKQLEQLAGHNWQRPSIKVAPGLHNKQIVVLVYWHLSQRSWSHLKQVPAVFANVENGFLQVTQVDLLADWQVAHGSSHKTQVEPTNEVGDTHAVQVVADVEHVAQGAVQGVQTAPGPKNVPSLQAVQVPAAH